MAKEEPLKVLAIGDYTTRTGLGTAINIPLRKLKKSGIIDPVMLGTGFNGWYLFLEDEFHQFPILPMIPSPGKPPDIFGKSCLHLAIEQYRRKFDSFVDMVLVCQDIQNQSFVAEPERAIKRGEINRQALSVLSKRTRTFKHAAYFPIDGLCKDETFHPVLAKTIKEIEYPVCICHWIQKALKRELDINADMIYHGVDNKVFYPVDKREAREKIGLYEAGLPEDAFIVGMIGTNQERKKFEDFIPAMAEFIKGRDNVYFYMFTEYVSKYEGAHDLLQLMKSYGVNKRCINTLKFLGCPDEFMRYIYGMADVTVLLSVGEGFGIPPLYSRAMKIPCFVTDCTAMSELCADSFERIPVKWSYFDKGINLVRHITDIDELVKRLIVLYDNQEKIKEIGEKGYKMAHKVFDYDRVIIPQWERFFEKVKKDLKDNPPVGRLRKTVEKTSPEMLFPKWDKADLHHIKLTQPAASTAFEGDNIAVEAKEEPLCT